MAAGEEEPQAVIGSHRSSCLDARAHCGGLARQLLHPLAIAGMPPQSVDCLAACRGHQPGAGVIGDAVLRPVLEGGDGGILHQLLGHVPVAEDADERRGQATALVTQDVGKALVDERAVSHAPESGAPRGRRGPARRTRWRVRRRDRRRRGSRSRQPSPCPR